mmetsp:Transcript_19618/g.45674  ORF Transcript_19618/g.45674 Transcript_19618/m.45674 type:complete len:471 (-) Transcript_19618:149-1561(-)
MGQFWPGPWHGFLFSCLGRVCGASALVLWIEARVIGAGIAPAGFSAVAFYGMLVFIGSVIVRNVIDTVSRGPTPDRAVTSQSGTLQSGTVSWATCGMRGWRPSMEDAHVVQSLSPLCNDVALFAVLDGHGGKQVSELAAVLLVDMVQAACREQMAAGSSQPSLAMALEQALPRLDTSLRSGPWGLARLLPSMLHPFAACGSTACVAAVDFSRREVIVANVGDSRAMLIRKGKAIPLSDDHKPENPQERSRIHAAGGQVLKIGPCHRVDGNLNLSRALGDFDLKANSQLPAEKQKVIAVPDTTTTKFQGGSQELLVVACDGLFERCSNQDIADIVWPRLKQGLPLERIGQELLLACCARDNQGMPIEAGTDNETVILVRLPASPESKDDQEEATGPVFQEGQRVVIHGLESAAGKQLNGKAAIVEGAAESPGRYEVRLIEKQTMKALRPENLKLIESSDDAGHPQACGGVI